MTMTHVATRYAHSRDGRIALCAEVGQGEEETRALGMDPAMVAAGTGFWHRFAPVSSIQETISPAAY